MAEAMKIRAQMQGEIADIKVLVSHPMETGQRKDAKGELIPVHFIKQVRATLNGKMVLDAQWSQAIAKNPFLGFKIKGAKAGDKVSVSWADNKGESNSIETTIAAAN
ncbi:MAG TPA: thiosulfate oxidation carrier complex protein SoxZ [Burkholderiales bacterium]|jgi:sulfur-oxidizing protein SoxZ|nr:thiosulfate oxidation carrier complex protein SoxZ [Burkholderiales bacterium]